jgi:hypothetical protein
MLFQLSFPNIIIIIFNKMKLFMQLSRLPSFKLVPFSQSPNLFIQHPFRSVKSMDDRKEEKEEKAF